MKRTCDQLDGPFHIRLLEIYGFDREERILDGTFAQISMIAWGRLHRSVNVKVTGPNKGWKDGP